MVKASSQIEQELALLQQKTEQMADALEPLYEGYLKALSEAGSRQLVLAAYHLCTKAYPDKFLALSWDRRNQLQNALQKAAAKIYAQLTEQRESAKIASRRSQNHEGLAFLQRLLEARASGQSEARSAKNRSGDELLAEENSAAEDEADLDRYDGGDRSIDTPYPIDFSSAFEVDSRGDFADDFDTDEAIDFEDEDSGDASSRQRRRRADSDEDDLDFEMEVPAADQRLTLNEEEDLLSALAGLTRRSIQLNSSSSPSGLPAGNADSESEQPLAPVHLAKQQMLLEKSIREVFQAVSEEANELLQKADVMPNFPRALLAAASDSRGMGEPINAVPNVVRVSVRVMHGEAMMESEEDEFEEDFDEDLDEESSQRRSTRGRMSRKLNRKPNRNFERNAERRSDQDSEESGRRSDMRGRSSSSGSSARRMRRIAPQDLMEIDALPELAAISLRLSEVEFADPTVSAWRGRLRQKLGELKKLGMRYKKAQRSLETAQAEDAWRASWTAQQDNANS
ncbi:MAG: hypothetical protein WBA76_10525 [Phormidesmis sp.]